ncbi:MAG: hypothetical protein WD638_11580 [Nitriliruptoraceae bacterium]
MTRRLLAVGAVVLVLGLVGGAALALSSDWEGGGADSEGGLENELRSPAEVDAGALDIATGTAVSQVTWVAQPIWSAGDPDINLGVCRGWHYVAAETDEEAALLRQEGRNEYLWLFDSLYSHEFPGVEIDVDCPGGAAAAVPAVVLRDAVRTAVTGQLPRPEPWIAPGFALTGLDAYLDTGPGHDLRYDQTEIVEVGPFTYTVEVAARGTTSVDWGDGSDAVTYEVPGRPYPSGAIHHVYRDAGPVDVTVIDRWVIDFRVVDPVTIVDTVTAVLAPTSIEELQVRGYRSVRVSR